MRQNSAKSKYRPAVIISIKQKDKKYKTKTAFIKKI